MKPKHVDLNHREHAKRALAALQRKHSGMVYGSLTLFCQEYLKKMTHLDPHKFREAVIEQAVNFPTISLR